MVRYTGLSFVPLAMVVLGLTGCQVDKDGLSEKARIEGKASSEASFVAEKANLLAKAKEMESDLATRHRFYQAVRGTFEGTLLTGQGTYKIRLTLVPSLNPYPVSRVRQLDEIVSDLNNLHFNAQVLQWNPENPLSAVGCRVGGIRADLASGEITIASDTCSNLYALRIAVAETPLSESSAEIAARIFEGKVDRIDSIAGEVSPSTNASTYSFVVARVRMK